MKQFKVIPVFMFCLAVVFLNPSAYGSRQNTAQPQHQNVFSKTVGNVSKGIGTGAVWTIKAPYKVGKYILTEMFRPFVPIRNKMIDMFGVEVQE